MESKTRRRSWLAGVTKRGLLPGPHEGILSAVQYLLLAGLGVLAGCSATNEAALCRVGADCASGICKADGTCGSVVKDTGVATDAADTGVEDSAPVDAPPVDSGGCLPNKDFVVTAGELPLAAGLKATFRVATSDTFDTAGAAGAGGTRTWNLAGKFASDKDVLVNTLSPSGQWWSAKFPGATYAAALSSSSDLLGVFQLDAAALNLRGVVSPTDSATKTELTYATPIPTIKLPLALGASWKVTSNVSGTASGFASFYTEAYDVTVDQKGSLATPFATFDVLRVKIVLTRTAAGVPSITRTYAFVTECFGTVASVVSKSNELSEEFTGFSELRRLAP